MSERHYYSPAAGRLRCSQCGYEQLPDEYALDAHDAAHRFHDTDPDSRWTRLERRVELLERLFVKSLMEDTDA